MDIEDDGGIFCSISQSQLFRMPVYQRSIYSVDVFNVGTAVSVQLAFSLTTGCVVPIFSAALRNTLCGF